MTETRTRRPGTAPDRLIAYVPEAARLLGVDVRTFRRGWRPDRNGWVITVGDTERYIPNVGMTSRRRVPIAALQRAINGDPA